MGFIKETAYKVLDVLTGGQGIGVKISGFSLRLPTRYHRYFPPQYEEENFAFLQKHCSAGSTVIDIGAHIGLFSVRAGQLAGKTGKVYAFEPTPATQALLKKTIKINDMEGVIEPRNEAIGDKDGVTHFYVSDSEGDNSNSLVQYKADRALHAVEVKITSIDNFIRNRPLERVDFIKIDAEGFEYNVLLGCRHLFTQLKPYGILALHPNGIVSNGNSLEQIYDFMQEMNYDLFFEEKLMTREAFCSRSDLFDVQIRSRG
ncbi:MAG TPA: FkbM family methyltransferase [Flavisolibacter sp.]|jgi:FkbM family methyltransferase